MLLTSPKYSSSLWTRSSHCSSPPSAAALEFSLVSVFSCSVMASFMAWVNSKHQALMVILSLGQSQKSHGTRFCEWAGRGPRAADCQLSFPVEPSHIFRAPCYDEEWCCSSRLGRCAGWLIGYSWWYLIGAMRITMKTLTCLLIFFYDFIGIYNTKISR